MIFTEKTWIKYSKDKSNGRQSKQKTNILAIILVYPEDTGLRKYSKFDIKCSFLPFFFKKKLFAGFLTP